ncbi:PQQ-binding-like beta-propeller repeat protein [Arenibacter algicola]|uniref:outer membrane protein assembly factor BamB family protein n=1 Tax=Arenibacter algicola TaxID=616991 RepID=UPI001C0768F7|nr:PQQ-binding-like beta-propeller repeat protein [Arenibacter algicola]MBU2904087.1 PQQ-binding-like beta-propeller repeat protein [Arenibacter algicola]
MRETIVKMILWYKYVTITTSVCVFLISCSEKVRDKDWSVYGGDKEQIKYSQLNQIDTSNVKNLKVAWTYKTLDADASSQIQVNPIIVDNILYGVSPQLKLFAIDAATGKEKWVFNPSKFDESLNLPDTLANRSGGHLNYGINACRGVTMYKGKNDESRIFYTVASFLYCINAYTGKPMLSFGKNGRLSLYDHLESNRDIQNLRVTSTTPGIIYNDLIIVGTSLSEGEEAAPGHIRAYNLHTGDPVWIFHTVPKPGEEGHETWEDTEAYKYVGGANAWGGFSLDEERGIVFAATGTSNPDFYGGKRKGDNLFANTILALDAATGKRIWHFQTIHHDLWDWDLPTAPILVSVKKEGKRIDAVVQVSKQGFIYMLDRVNGEPVYPIEERAVPAESELLGEQVSPTQPFPTFFEPFVRQGITEADLNKNLPDSSYQDIKRRFSTYKSGEIFTPPTLRGTVTLPGFDGGANWGGPSFDPVTGTLYINAAEMPWIVTMEETKEKNELAYTQNQTNLQIGKALYRTNCVGCHGSELKGVGDFPSLVSLKSKYTEIEFKSILTYGRRMMPSFKYLSEEEKTALGSYILNIETKQSEKFTKVAQKKHPFYKAPYKLKGIEQFLSKEGYPAISPPWGTLSAINLNTGKIVWKNTLGDYPELKAKGIHSGTPNFGGSVVTAGGLIFIAATRDEKFRAFNNKTGELLFETTLPYAGYATPSIYSVSGKQYVVIACGGGKMKTKSGDAYVAFTVPDNISE